MVENVGKPLQRGLDAPCTTSSDIPHGALSSNVSNRELLNLRACFDVSVGLDEIKRYVASSKRLDIEQAAALAICQLPQQQALVALKTIPTILSESCMWREAKDLETLPDTKAAAIQNRLHQISQLLQQQGLQNCSSLENLTLAALSIRRKRPGQQDRQRLFVPNLLLDGLQSQPEAARRQWHETFRRGRQTDLPPEAGRQVKVISKKVFARLSAYLGRLAGDQSPAADLHRKIDELASLIQDGEGRTEALLQTSDTLALAFSFMALQRRRQLKVVSDGHSTTFLKKGEGGEVQQNNSDALTSFEVLLWELAISRPASEIDLKALTAVHTPDGQVSLGGDVLKLIDQVCLLMEAYVSVHGQGSYANLKFQRGSSGGSGRGPVDLYNQLVDLLRIAKKRAGQAGKPVDITTCHKFLAKDIMAWNDSWKDDAFSGGRFPGWEGWLTNRRSMGLLSGLQPTSMQCP